MIAAASLTWLALGEVLRSGRILRISAQAIRRIGAAVLLVFAVLIAASA